MDPGEAVLAAVPVEVSADERIQGGDVAGVLDTVVVVVPVTEIAEPVTVGVEAVIGGGEEPARAVVAAVAVGVSAERRVEGVAVLRVFDAIVVVVEVAGVAEAVGCLLYTSDAADE